MMKRVTSPLSSPLPPRPFSPELLTDLGMAGSHIDLRKRNQAFQQKAGKVNRVKPTEDLDKKPIPKWTVILLLALIGGGIFFELAQQVFNYLTRSK